jgi:hypothetical protein
MRQTALPLTVLAIVLVAGPGNASSQVVRCDRLRFVGSTPFYRAMARNHRTYATRGRCDSSVA